MSLNLARASADPKVSDDAALSDRTRHFERLVERYRRDVTRAAYRITRNIDDARDVAQFVFLQAYRHWSHSEEQRATERWLYIVMRNEAINTRRRRERDDSIAELTGRESYQRGLEEIVVRNERARAVRATIARLPANDRHVLELWHLEAMPVSEIAAQFGIPLRRVKQDVERARYRLRAEMVRLGLDSDVE